MKRYEERLLHEMQSESAWLLLTNPPSLVYRLPNEVLILVFECLELVDLKTIRWRFEGLATSLAFKILRMDNVRPSRMPMLAYLLNKNPYFGEPCRKLHLRMSNRLQTRIFPLGKGTTSHQDEAQAQVINSLPHLESLSIELEYALGLDSASTEASLWTERSGFTRTLEALSRCQSIRNLRFIGTRVQITICHIFLLGVLWMVSTTLERLEILGPFMEDSTTPIESTHPNDPITFPRLNNVTHLHIDHEKPLERLLKTLPEHFPALKTLVYNGSNYQFAMPRDAIVMKPLEQLILTGPVFSMHVWRIPTRKVQISWGAIEYRRALKKLCDTITAGIGVFSVDGSSGNLVGSISIKVVRPNWSTKFQIPWSGDLVQEYANLWPAQDPEQALVESLKGICVRRGIPLDMRISDSAPFLGYITSYAWQI